MIKGIFYNPKKIFVSESVVNVKVFSSEETIYKYRLGSGEYAHRLYDIHNNIIVYSQVPNPSFIGKLWAWVTGRYVFYKDNKEILRYLHSSLIKFPNDTELEHNFKKYNLDIDSCKIFFNEDKNIEFECKKDFLFETIVIGFNSFWFPYHHNFS
jgi:hypothetical protein